MKYIPHSKPLISEDDKESVLKCLNSGQISSHSLKKQFEYEVAEYLNYPFAISTTSGSNALKIILEALRVKAGDEIILPTYLCHSVYDAVKEAGATPILCDVSEQWIATRDEINPCITSRTKAIILVHLFGIDASDSNLNFDNITVIHDLCQAFGVKLNGKIKGPAFCSFHATKCLTTGEGGMALFDNEEQFMYAKERMSKALYLHKLSDLQASLGLSQLKKYDSFIQLRKIIVNDYLNTISKNYLKDTLSITNRSIFFRFPLKINSNVDEIIKKVELKYNIAFRKGVDELLHRKYGVLEDSSFTNAVKLFNSTISIPIYPALAKEDTVRIINVFKEIEL